MKLAYKQAIISHQDGMNGLQNFLKLQDGNVDLLASNRSFVYSLSIGTEDVVFTIQSDIDSAWKGVPQNVEVWLGIQHDRITGQRSFFTCTTAPTLSPKRPTTGTNNHLWYDTVHDVSYLYKNGKYVRSNCIVIGSMYNGSFRSSNGDAIFKGSTVRKDVETHAGHLILDSKMRPILDPSGNYLTTVSPISTLAHVTSNVRIGTCGFVAVAAENIAKHHIVKLENDGQLVHCNPSDVSTSLWGVIEDDCNVGDVVRVAVEGFFETGEDKWSGPNKRLYVSDSGEITESYSIGAVAIGYTVSTTAFVVRPVATGSVSGGSGGMGPRGLKGDKGDKGERGDIGNTGATGATGAAGIKGDKGDRGDNGAAGIKGDKGDRGDAGVIVSPTPPANPTIGLLWVDISGPIT